MVKSFNSQKGFGKIPILLFIIVTVVAVGIFYQLKNRDSKPLAENTAVPGSVEQKVNELWGHSQSNNNPYLGVPCTSNLEIQFTHDFTEVDKISSAEPTIITPGNSRHRAWLNIRSGKVPVYAPVDSELVNGVYKNARGALDYDLHFQVSCEIWYLINHLTEPVDKIKNAFPQVPQTDTKINPPFKEPIKFKAGELLGYTTGTPVAHNFDFGVFDLNHFNDELPADGGSKYGKEKNFICPFDVLPEKVKKSYYSKIISSEKPFTNCRAY